MRADNNTHTIGNAWRSNHSRIWLPFVVPFVLPYCKELLGVPAATALFLITLAGAALLYKRERERTSWKRAFFILPFLLLASTYITLFLSTKWHVEWCLMTIALSSGWLWHIEERLVEEQPLELREWLFTTRLFGFGSLALLLLYIVFPNAPIWLVWLPPIAIGIGILAHQARLMYIRRKLQTFSCPIGAPLVRMAIIKDDQLWLTKRPYTGCYIDAACTPCHSAQPYDHPLTSCVNPNETPEEAISRAFQSTQLDLQTAPRFLLKYVYRNSCNQERTIYFFVLNIPKDKAIRKLTLRGHFYSSKEVEKGIREKLFKPMFIEEYKYLKQTLFKANQLSRQTNESIDTSGVPL